MLNWLKSKLPFVSRREYEHIVACYEDRGDRFEELNKSLDVALQQRDDFFSLYDKSEKEASQLRKKLV